MRRPSVVLFTAALLAALVAPPAAAAKPTAAVSLGDSYISGEAGRWAGNSLRNTGSRRGTDRAWTGSSYDRNRVYLDGSGFPTGCHRSDVADIHSAGADALGVDTTINLACSGADARDLWRASTGGTSQNGRPPQADQLAAVAASYDVELVVVSVGGNDIGFAEIILACTEAWFTSPSWWKSFCYDDEQPRVDARLPEAMADVATAIDEVRDVLAAAGDDQYRIVLRSYPSPIPRGGEFRYRQSGWSRWERGGCPFWNRDATWARDELVPQLSSALADVAAASGVDFLDQQDLLQGREVCARGTSHSDGSPSSVDQEWVRWFNTGLVQGDAQESLHPNAFGQQAAGACLTAWAAAGGGDRACANVPGEPATVVTSTAVP